MTHKKFRLPKVDPATLKGKTTETRWIPVDFISQLFWQENPKAHDIGALVHSIRIHGFRERPAYDKNLINVSDREGAIVTGNGRTEAVVWMYTHDEACPDGVLQDADGMWYIGVEFGLDAESKEAAEAYGIDNNSVALRGGDLQNFEQWRIYDERKLKALGKRIYEAGLEMASIDADDMDDLFGSMEQDGKLEQGRDLSDDLDVFLNSDIRRLVIFLPNDEYDKIVEQLDAVMEHAGTQDHTETFIWMLGQHETTRPEET